MRGSPHFPKLRSDVLVKDVGGNRSGVFIIRDPTLDPLRFFQCSALQVEIVRRLDGKSSVEAIARSLRERFRTDISTEKVAAFISSLDRRFLLEPESTDVLPAHIRVAASRKALSRWRRRGLMRHPERGEVLKGDEAVIDSAAGWLRGQDPSEAARCLVAALDAHPDSERLRLARSVLRAAILEHAPRTKPPGPMIPLFDPYPLLLRLHLWCRFAFSGWFLASLGVLSAVSLTITFAHWDRFGALLVAHSWDLVKSLGGLVIFFLVVLAHELGHGVACVHYGGRPRQIGIIVLLYVMVAAYCDVTDSVLFDGRRPKIVTFMAGIITTTALWCIVTPLWWLTKPGTALNELLLLASAISGVTNLVQLLPLYKFDGHFVLAALAEHQNLFEEAWESFRREVVNPFFARARAGFGDRVWTAGLLNAWIAPLLVAFLLSGTTMLILSWVFCLFGVADLFVHAIRSRGAAHYARLLRKFAIYALTYYAVWIASLAEVMWNALVPSFKGWGALLTVYLIVRGSCRLGRLAFGPRAKPLRDSWRALAWAPALILWIGVDVAVLLAVPCSIPADGEVTIVTPRRFEEHASADGAPPRVAIPDGQRGAPTLRGQVRFDASQPAANVRQGQRVRVFPRTGNAEPLEGRIASVARAFEEGHLLAVIDLERAPGWLRAGATGRARVEGPTSSLLHSVAQPLVSFIELELWRIL